MRYFLWRKLCVYGAFFVILTAPGALFGEEMGNRVERENGIRLIEAVKIAIEKQPDTLITEQQVEFSKGQLQKESGAFDPSINVGVSHAANRTPTLPEGSTVRRDATTGSVSVDKKLRTGVTLTPSLEVGRVGEGGEIAFGFTETPVVNRASVNFTVSIPLLRGAGRAAAGADEMAARVNVEASRLDLLFQVSSSIRQTAQAFWQYRASLENLEISRLIEKRARQLLDNIQGLVDGGEQPPSDLNQLVADLAQKTSRRIGDEQALLVARQNLGIAMGLPYKEIVSLPLPADPFPEPVLRDIPVQPSVDVAGRSRKDLLASKERERIQEILLVAARKNVRPRFDLEFKAGYAGLDEGGEISNYWGALYSNLSGLNVTGGFALEYPYGNNARRGDVYQRLSEYRRVAIQTADLERKILSNVVVAIQALERSVLALREARESVAYYKKAVEGERLKLLLGMTTVVDTLTLEESLNQALLVEVGAERNYADSVVNLRFEMGILVSDHGELNVISEEQLTTIPQ